MKKIIIGITIGIILCGGIVYAAITYKSSDILYESSDASWEVSNVDEALNSLYKIINENSLNSSEIKNGLSLATHMHGGHENQINVSGYKTLTVLDTSTTLSITLTADDGTVLSTTSSRGEVIDVSNYDYVIAKFTTYADSYFSSFNYILNY